MRQMEEKMDNIIESLKFTGEEVERIKKDTIPNLEKNVEEKHRGLCEELEKLQVYVARENMVFLGVPEVLVDGQENTREVVDTFLKDKLQMNADIVENIEFQRVHRVPAAFKPRPIKARVLRFPDKIRILEKAHLLKGTKMVVADDLPFSIRRQRKAQIEVLVEARKAGYKAHFSRQDPAKLFVDGRNLSREEQGNFLEKLKSRRPALGSH